MSDSNDDNSEFLDEDPEEAFDAEQFSQQFDDQLLDSADDGKNVKASDEAESENDEFDDDTFEDFGDTESEELLDESEDADADEEHFDVGAE